MAEAYPACSGNDGHEAALDPYRILDAVETPAAGYPLHMCVNDYTFSRAEGRTHDYVSGLAGDTREGQQLVHLARNLSPVMLVNSSCGGDYVSGLVPEETGRPNQRLHLQWRGMAQRGGIRKVGEQPPSDLVYDLVGALSR